VISKMRTAARLGNALALGRGIKAAIKVARGPSEVHPALFGSRLQGVEALRQQDHGGLVDGRHGDRRSAGAMLVAAGKALVALRVVGPRVPNALPPFWATVCVPAPGRMVRSRCFAAARGRTLAPNACQSAPSSAHVAKTLSLGVSWRAGVPWASCGMGNHFPCLPL
jgi:hypothetical protein